MEQAIVERDISNLAEVSVIIELERYEKDTGKLALRTSDRIHLDTAHRARS